MIHRLVAIAVFAGTPAFLGACFADVDDPIPSEQVGTVQQAVTLQDCLDKGSFEPCLECCDTLHWKEVDKCYELCPNLPSEKELAPKPDPETPKPEPEPEPESEPTPPPPEELPESVKEQLENGICCYYQHQDDKEMHWVVEAGKYGCYGTMHKTWWNQGWYDLICQRAKDKDGNCPEWCD